MNERQEQYIRLFLELCDARDNVRKIDSESKAVLQSMNEDEVQECFDYIKALWSTS